MTDRSDVLARIRKLHQRTTGRGCSEAEALAAATKMADLMAEHGVSADDLDMDEQRSRNRSSGKTVRDRIWGTVASCTNSAAVFTEDDTGHVIIWIGRAPGPEIADYLHALLSGAINRELAEFRKGSFYRRRRTAKTKAQAVEQFTYGLVGRLAGRPRDMFRGTTSEEARKAASRALDRQFPQTKTIKHKQVAERFDEARASGWAAGGRVGLHHGVNADVGGAAALNAPQLRLGGPTS